MRSSLLAMLFIFMGWTTVGATGRSPLQNPSSQPTLARFSFWVSPARMSEFEAAYEAKLIPILKRHGLTESSERGRATPDSIFSRLFELKTPLEVEEKQKALQGDVTWTVALRSLGATFGMPQEDGLIRFAFTLYAAPAGPGKTVPAGPGKTVPAGEGRGHWRTYDATDGLVGWRTRSILQDREGNLWFSSQEGGVSRYDGPPLVCDRGSPVARCVQGAASRVTGRAPEEAGVAYWMDAALFAEAGIPTVNYGPAGAGAHEAVEWVGLGSVVTCAKVLVEAAQRFCRDEGRGHV